MNDEEKKDILFQIDMQLYDEFNDKFCEMNDNLGTFYTYKDIDDLEKLEKETEIKLLRKAIEKQQKEIEKLKENNGYHLGFIDGGIAKRYEYEDKIKAKIEELEKGNKNTFIRGEKILVLQSLLEKE